MATQIELHTKRLILKGISPQLIHELFNSKTKDEIIAYFGYNEDEYNRMNEMHIHGMEAFRHTAFYFLLLLKENNTPIGDCGFHTINHEHRRAEIFYSLRHDIYKHKGYMTEALQSVLQYGFNQMNLHRICALIAPSNTPSRKLIQHFGFTFEGTMREDYKVNGKNEDSDCFSLLKHEWVK